MKKYFIIIIFAFFCKVYGQSTFKFKFQNSYQISNLKSINIITKKFFLLSDNNLNYFSLHYYSSRDRKKKLIDRVEFSPYASTLYSYKLKDNNSYIIFWETEYEYYPIVKVYYIINDRLHKIGELMISLPCKTCESFEYPLKKVKVLKKGNEIQISFLEDVNCKLKESSKWKFFKKGAVTYLYNTKTDSLTIKKND